MPADSDNGWQPTADEIESATALDDESPPAARGDRRPRYNLLTDAELESVPPPTYLVEGLVVAESLLFPFGAPGSGKSFFMLDMGRSIAAGRPFLGRRTRQGPVIFVAAEGTHGIARRLRAWSCAKNDGESLSNFWVVPQPLPMLDQSAVAAFAADVRETVGEHVSLIVLDTLARCSAGGDENSSADMGRFVASCDYLRTTFGATVAPVHHSGKAEGAGMRGSTALIGAADTALSVKRDEASGVITVQCAKQKDAAPVAPIRLQLEPVPGVGSCVLEPADAPPDPEPDLLDKPRALGCLAALRGLGPSGSYADWQKASGLPGTSFNRMRSQLVAKRLVEPLGDRYRVAREAESRL